MSETFEAQPGYYFAFGETLDELADNLSLVRLYFHCAAENAALARRRADLLPQSLSDAISVEDAGFTAPLRARRRRRTLFRLPLFSHCRADCRASPRESPARSCDAALHQDLVAGRRRGCRARHRRELRLAPMPACSGRNCRRLAQGEQKTPARLAASRRAFAGAGLDLSRPWLGPTRPDPFQHPAACEAAVTGRRDHFLRVAAAIGRRLCRDAVWHDGRCNWLGWAMEPHGGQWVSVYRAMGGSVYDGAAGIGLFLRSPGPPRRRSHHRDDGGRGAGAGAHRSRRIERSGRVRILLRALRRRAVLC